MVPEYVEFFFTSQAGILALTLAVIVETIGVVWLWNIIRLDY
jgi:Flp pilus assembly protein TadB